MYNEILKSQADELVQTTSKFIDIRVVQRNGRKTTTTIEGLVIENLQDLLKHWKKKFSCNGSIAKDVENIVILSGNQADLVKKFLLDEKLATENKIRVHGL
jgi:translation initiation factor 1